MDDVRLGQLFRAARIRRGWRQCDVAARAGVGRTVISKLERGDLASISLGRLRGIATVLELRVDVTARWRGADGERLLSRRHSRLVESVARDLVRDGWELRPEVSFSIYGERGVVDLLAWHPKRQALLVVEIKTEIVDVGELLGTFDRKRRLARKIAASVGWFPEHVSAWLLVGRSGTNLRRVADNRFALRAALPSDGRRLRSWRRDPVAATAGLAFVSYASERGTSAGLGGLKRVRRPREGRGRT